MLAEPLGDGFRLRAGTCAGDDHEPLVEGSAFPPLVAGHLVPGMPVVPQQRHEVLDLLEREGFAPPFIRNEQGGLFSAALPRRTSHEPRDAPQEIVDKSSTNFGEGDPVRAVGWAESDYWAKRVWETPFSGRLDAPGAQWGGPPSLWFLGRPEVLSFASVLDFEKARPGARRRPC
jgi:hypothetical protein